MSSKKTILLPPPDGGFQHPRDDLPPPEGDNVIQHYLDRERRRVWIYFPQSFEMTAEFAAMLQQQYGRRYWDAATIHILASEQIRKNGMCIIL